MAKSKTLSTSAFDEMGKNKGALEVDQFISDFLPSIESGNDNAAELHPGY